MAQDTETTELGEVKGGFRLIPPPPKRRRDPQFTALRRRAVQMFAHFSDLKGVSEAIRDEFGSSPHIMQLVRWNPEHSLCRLPRSLHKLWEEERKRCISQLSSIGLAHQGQRLRMLDRMAQAAERKEQFTVAAGLLKQAAEEMGGLLTNERKVNVQHLHLSLADAKAELAMRLEAFAEQVELLPAPTEPSDDSQVTEN